jgi:heat shock protein HslJ
MQKFVAGLITGLALASLIGFGLLLSHLEASDVYQEVPAGQAKPEEAALPVTPGLPAAADLAALADRNFVIHSFDGQELREEGPSGAPLVWPNLSFGEWPEVTGRICNHFRGTAEVTAEGRRLKILAAATRMMCLEENINQLENVFQKITTEGADFSLSPDGRVLILSGDGHILVFHLRDYRLGQ